MQIVHFVKVARFKSRGSLTLLSITGFSDFGHRHYSKNPENTMFRKRSVCPQMDVQWTALGPMSEVNSS
jgi:hypothetical protein